MTLWWLHPAEALLLMMFADKQTDTRAMCGKPRENGGPSACICIFWQVLLCQTQASLPADH